MGLFEKAGRRFERFKQKATSAAEEQADYECYACGHRFYADGDECPECGSEAVAPAEDDDAEADGTDDATATEPDDGAEASANETE